MEKTKEILFLIFHIPFFIISKNTEKGFSYDCYLCFLFDQI